MYVGIVSNSQPALFAINTVRAESPGVAYVLGFLPGRGPCSVTSGFVNSRSGCACCSSKFESISDGSSLTSGERPIGCSLEPSIMLTQQMTR